MARLIIRIAKADDHPAMVRTYRSARLASPCWAHLPPATASDFFQETEGESLWVAESPNKEVVGFVSVWLPESFVHHLYVEPSLQRHGIGRALLSHIHALGLPKPLTLKCLEANHPALAFYTKQGWKMTSRGLSEQGEFVLMESGTPSGQS